MAASLLCRVSGAKLAPWLWSTTRALSVAPVLSAKTQPAVDPVKRLFVDKVKVCLSLRVIVSLGPTLILFILIGTAWFSVPSRLLQEYQAKRSKEGKSPGMRPEDEKQLADELVRLKHVYGEGDLSQFPKFDFKEDIKLGEYYLSS